MLMSSKEKSETSVKAVQPKRVSVEYVNKSSMELTTLSAPSPDKVEANRRKQHLSQFDLEQFRVLMTTQQKVSSELTSKPVETNLMSNGYNSSSEPVMDSVSKDIYTQILDEHMKRRCYWAPARYKRFPRFAMFTQSKMNHSKSPKKERLINLNPGVIALLAGVDYKESARVIQELKAPGVV